MMMTAEYHRRAITTFDLAINKLLARIQALEKEVHRRMEEIRGHW